MRSRGRGGKGRRGWLVVQMCIALCTILACKSGASGRSAVSGHQGAEWKSTHVDLDIVPKSSRARSRGPTECRQSSTCQELDLTAKLTLSACATFSCATGSPKIIGNAAENESL